MSDVFISYSRKNSLFARRLIDKLIMTGKDAWVDWEGIPLTSPNWWLEIRAGIEGADNFMFILSPDSMASVVCNMELDYAIELNKRIVPVVHQNVETRDAFASIADFKLDEAMEERLEGKDPLIIARDNWQRLSHINWIFIREEDDFDSAFDTLVTTVETDLEYVKAHTRYLVRAQEWERENRRVDLLLFGKEIDRGESWLKKAEDYEILAATNAENKVAVVNPLPKDLHREYIRVSRQADRRRRRLIRSAQLSIFVLLIVVFVGLLVGTLIISRTQSDAASIQSTSAQNVAVAETQLAGVQPTLASANTQVAGVQPTLAAANATLSLADTQVANANNALTSVPPTMTQIALSVLESEARNESRRLASLAVGQLDSGNAYFSALLAIRALNNAYTPEADSILFEAMRQNNGRFSIKTGSIWAHFSINSVSYSPDGQYILTASDDKTTVIWDAETGERVRTFAGHSEAVNSAVYNQWCKLKSS